MAQTDSRSPLVCAFQFLGGLHAAIAIQCVMALAGLRSWKEMLVGMAILHRVLSAFAGRSTTGALASQTWRCYSGQAADLRWAPSCWAVSLWISSYPMHGSSVSPLCCHAPATN